MEKATSPAIIHDFRSGNIPLQMIAFSAPFMLSNALQVLYALVDMVVVGRFIGSFGLSAVSVASQVFTFMTMLALGFCTGGQVYISQLIGSGNRRGLGRAIGTLFSVVGLLGAAMTALGLLLRRPVLALLDTPPEAFGMAMDYMLVCSCGILFTYGYNLISAILRGMGDSRHPFIFILIASAVNLVLDLVFVGVFSWGVAGAALATILGQGVSFFFAIFYLRRHKEHFGFDFRAESFQIDGKACRALTRLGIPFALQSCAINISMLFINRLVNGVGVYASATFGVGLKLDDIINKVTQGLNFAVSAMVGQNIAAKEYRRIRGIVLWGIGMSGACYLLFSIIYLLCSQQMFGLFTGDAEVIKLAPVFVSAIVWSFPAMAMMRGTNGLIQGIGNAPLGLWFALLDGFVFRILLSYLLGTVFGLGLFGFFLGYGLAAYGTAIPGLIYFLSGRWEKYRLVIAGEEA